MQEPVQQQSGLVALTKHSVTASSFCSQ